MQDAVTINDQRAISRGQAYHVVGHESDSFWPEIFRQLQTYCVAQAMEADKLKAMAQVAGNPTNSISERAEMARTFNEKAAHRPDLPEVQTVLTVPQLEIDAQVEPRRNAATTQNESDKSSEQITFGQILAFARQPEKKSTDNRYNASTLSGGSRSSGTSLPPLEIA
jgi:hypothetical protein